MTPDEPAPGGPPTPGPPPEATPAPDAAPALEGAAASDALATGAGAAADAGSVPRVPPDYDPERMSPAGWVYPRTLGMRFSDASRRLFQVLVVAGAVLVLALTVLWGVPSAVVATSDPYARAKARAAAHPEVRAFVGQPITCARVPERYRLEDDGGTFRFEARGPRGEAVLEAKVEGESVRLLVREVRGAW